MSLALHAPPVTIFLVSWLTRSLLLEGGNFDLPEPRNSVVYYQVPVALLDTFPGLGNGAGKGGGEPTAGGAGVERRGTVGPGRRRTRRPLVFHRENERVKTVAISKSLMGEEIDGTDEGADGFGLGGAGGVGNGTATGPGIGGPGGDGAGPGGRGVIKAAEPNPNKGPRPRAKGRNSKDEETGKEFQGDDETVVGAPLPGRPTRISMDHGEYLRTHDTYPSPLPDSCWPPGRIANTFLVEICVSEAGTVSEVKVRHNSAEEADNFLQRSIRSWRYRPLMVSGSPRPFCHPIIITYKREVGFGRRF